MVELSAQAGYQAVSIAQVSSHAGVSSATFYEQFENREDCLLAAYRAANERTFDRMRRVMGDRDWAHATREAFQELLRGGRERTVGRPRSVHRGTRRWASPARRDSERPG